MILYVACVAPAAFVCTRLADTEKSTSFRISKLTDGSKFVVTLLPFLILKRTLPLDVSWNVAEIDKLVTAGTANFGL